MLISDAYAQTADAMANVPPAPDPMWNFGMLVVMIVLFYVLLIMPQQKRFKEHKKMLEALEKGDSVITGGGLVGKVSKIINDEEVEVDLGNNMVVTVRRATISGKAGETAAPLKAAEKPAKKKAASKKAEAKVATPAKAAAKPKAKKSAAKKTASKAAPKKVASKKMPAKKAPAKKATAKKATAKKA